MLKYDKNRKFTFEIVSISDIAINKGNVIFNGQEYCDSPRFWDSLFSRFSFNNAFFNYFSHEEVFNRIKECKENHTIRVCVYEYMGKKSLLAVSNPIKSLACHDDLIELFEKNNTLGISYEGGVITSNHKPSIDSSAFEIAGESYSNTFSIKIPIDGYGQPNIFVSFLKSTNGSFITPKTKCFQSSINFGNANENMIPSLNRIISTFNNDEAYSALRDRIESSNNSFASLNEASRYYKCLDACMGFKYTTIGNSSVVKRYINLVGDISKVFGIASVDSVSIRRQKILPVNCSVYDIIKDASEFGTHCVSPEGTKIIDCFIGGLVANEYDLENTKDGSSEYKDIVGKQATQYYNENC